jgi:hypothetical protein
MTLDTVLDKVRDDDIRQEALCRTLDAIARGRAPNPVAYARRLVSRLRADASRVKPAGYGGVALVTGSREPSALDRLCMRETLAGLDPAMLLDTDLVPRRRHPAKRRWDRVNHWQGSPP